MKAKHVLFIGVAALALLVVTPAARARPAAAQLVDQPTGSLVAAVRSATAGFANAEAAKAAGYELFHGCVSGPLEGAMGIHLVNNDLVGDGALDPMRPEAVLYEVQNGQYEILGVEYVVIADAWYAHTEGPPLLMGQLFNYVSSPNRFGIPAFYELHVWAWKDNPNGTFADWNPTVSCDGYTAPDVAHASGH
ncbi:MAG: hypothetical protein ACRDJE_19715 [Dehalococcoidia bacterium]